jgi:hypothetical protein
MRGTKRGSLEPAYQFGTDRQRVDSRLLYQTLLKIISFVSLMIYSIR